ncbi:MAG TPA: histidine phosphatase family protein [Ignavibacteria bacterium]|nr:histidine phosphatase family protein [Ignavibacteria bacterium]HRK00434.1 histidine phosphatase family protein [Ignavibacteria bacterium]
MRHAKSSWDYPELDDHDRPLNKRGKSDAPLMAEVLKERNIYPDLILSSTAVRAIKFAKIIAKKLDYDKNKIFSSRDFYLASVSEIINEFQSLDNRYNSVFFVGHNPEITLLANFLSAKDLDNIPTSGIFAVKFDINYWDELDKDKGKFNFFIYPKMFYDKY